MKALLHVDGGARGTNKHALVGVSLANAAGVELLALSAYTGPGTSNQAEYRALICGLYLARFFAVRELVVFADSDLMVRQMNRSCACNSQHLRSLHQQASRLARQFPKFTITHVCREDNQRADALASRAMSERTLRIDYTGPGDGF